MGIFGGKKQKESIKPEKEEALDLRWDKYY
jgi:hypothetical protein